MDTKIKVINPGLLTTVQDSGRKGYQKQGIPVSGVMDTDAYEAANALVRNSENAAVLEMTVWGGSFSFTGDAICALTGADMQPVLDGKAVPMYQAFQVHDGSRLDLHPVSNGCRTYLAVSGGIDVPVVMGSRSTYRKCLIGGFEGRELRAGDILSVGETEADNCTVSDPKYSIPTDAKTASGVLRRYEKEITVRVVMGPQDDYFTEKGIKTFFSGSYTVSDQSDRMGCRLEGPVIESVNGTDIISDGTVFGSIQVTGAGLPIVLMADRQTTGGYAKIATVCTEDLPLLAQAMPGTIVHFTK